MLNVLQIKIFNAETIQRRKLFKGGNYSRKYGIYNIISVSTAGLHYRYFAYSIILGCTEYFTILPIIRKSLECFYKNSSSLQIYWAQINEYNAQLFTVSLCLDFKKIWSFDLHYILNSSFTIEVGTLKFPHNIDTNEMNDNVLFP